VFAAYGGSASCRDCHQQAYDRWQHSHHALAERPLSLAQDLPVFYPPRTFQHGAQVSEARFATQRFEVFTLGPARLRQTFPLERVIGVRPLRQFLVAWPGGRHQVTEIAADPDRRDWFDIFGNEDRQPGEWGHWTGRGMNWNNMCAACHNTRVRKNYQPATDTYATGLAEAGVGCEACHGPMADHVAWQRGQPQPPPVKDPTLRALSKDQMLAACGACHARRSELTGDFTPGDLFLDHFGLVIPDETDLFHADGQVREEDYEYASFLSSRMFTAGVRCGDCHDPHSGRVFAVDNSLCLRCHSPPQPPAPKIEPALHTFHRPGEAGDRCVDCHMPQTVYMQRHGRHDHGFTIPDPLLTKEHGIPNACNRCHNDQSTDWALAAVERWYGARMERPSRARARALAQARAGQAVAVAPLLNVAAEDKIALWRAVALGLLKPWSAMPEVTARLLNAATDPEPLVRTLAARALEPLAATEHAPTRATLHRLLADPVRSVRVEAAWALRARLDTNSPAGKDLARHLLQNSDQPGGLMQMGVFHLDRGDGSAALALFERAVDWDQGSAPLRAALAVALSTLGRSTEAVRQLEAACSLAPREAEYRFKLGLALNEAGRLNDALAALAEAVRLDARHAQAWYNLGLAYAAVNRPEDALEALSRAEPLDPSAAQVPYARATVLAALGRGAEARAAARRALQLQPQFTAAARLLEALEP
jgi:tetratricopeptide (TPR) repeat protein